MDEFDRDRRESENMIKAAAFVAIGLGIINVIIVMFIGFLILKGSAWTAL